MKKLILTLSAASICSLAMAQTTVSRLVQKATWDGSAPQMQGDSTYYIYKDTLSWDAVLLKWKCDTAVTMRKSSTGFTNSSRTSNKFDAQNRISEELLESFNFAGTIATPNKKNVYTYSAQGKLATDELSSYNNGSWVAHQKTLHTYNTQGNLTETVLQYRTVTGLTNSQRSIMTYNTSGQLDTTTNFYWDAPNSLWMERNRSTNYYTGMQVSLIVFESFDPGAGVWMIGDSATNTYNTNGELIEQLYRFNNMGTWVDYSKFIYAFDVNGNRIDSLYRSTPTGPGVPVGPLQDIARKITTYNSFGQPLTETHKMTDFSGNPLIITEENFFYYEQFNAEIEDKVAQAGTINIYPVPANNTLAVDLNWNETQPAAILIFDMTGKLAAQWTIPSTKQHTQTLDISNITSGTYMLKVVGTKGTLSRQVNIVK